MKIYLPFLLITLGLVLSACQPLAALGVIMTRKEPVPAPDSNLDIFWSFPTAGPIWGTPTLDAGVLYFGSDDGSLYAVNAGTHEQKWKFATQGIIRSRPAVADGLVYIASDDGFLYAVKIKNGQEAWRADIGNALDATTRGDLGTSTAPTGWDYVQSSPVVADGLVYVGSLDGNVYAIDAKTGQVAWTYRTGNKVRGTAVVDNGVVYIGSWDENFYALDAKTGQLNWEYPIGGEVQSTALVTGGLVICPSRKASVVAMDVQTGEKKWEYSYGNNMWVESSPALYNDQVLIGSSGSRMVVALHSDSGEVASAHFSVAFHWSTPMVLNDTVYIGGAGFSDPQNGGLFALKLTDGKMSMTSDSRRILSIPDTLEYSGKISGVAGSPITEDGVIYFGALDGKLYAVVD
jgi:eukaryotic-like serine/threonine-protein kinase